jgi:hypothetical protein
LSKAGRQRGMTKKKQKLIVDLLCGCVERDKRGRLQRRYLKKDSPEETDARRALARELRTAQTLDMGFRDLLAELINPRRDSPRRIVFENNGAGNKSNALVERQVAEFLWLKGRPRGQMEAAISEAKKDFGLERSRVMAIWHVWKPILERHYRIHGPITEKIAKKYFKEI